MDNLLELYRLQGAPSSESRFLNKTCPVRRVIISGSGKIVLNPNSDKFIYFSKSKAHHAYYVYHKVVKIIINELNKAKKNPAFANLDIPDNFREYRNYSNVSYNVIKQVKHFFENYLPPKDVELVTLQYLNAFSQLFEMCAVNNKTAKKTATGYPEISDRTLYGGAYGVNDAWLELLKECTVASKCASIPLTRVLDEIINCKHMIEVHSKDKHISHLTCNQLFFQALNNVTYTSLINPDFLDRNTPNRITNLLELIEEYQMYSPDLNIGKTFFAEQRRIFKDEYKEQIDLIR